VRIAFDHQVFAQQRFGGISRYFVELAARLPAHGEIEVAVIAPFHQNEYLRAAAIPGKRTWCKLTPGRIGIKRALRWGNRLALPLAWRGQRFDILHETFFSRQCYGQTRVRVLTMYDMIHELFPAELVRTDEIAAAKRAAVTRADHIICISRTTQRDLIRLLSVDPAKTSVIHLGHSLGATAHSPSQPDGPPILLYVGDRASYTNFGAAAEAFARSPRLRRELQLVAFGGRPFSARERQSLAALGIADRVRHESGSDEQLAARYRQARLLVCPSTYEGFGLPPLEALSLGCPVACSDRGSIPEVVGDAGEYFNPDDSDAMSAALERVAFDEARRRQLVALGRARAAQFTWEKCAAETAATYRQLLAR
jgi:glycosyltransferase involved in cell wall biosynthesis